MNVSKLLLRSLIIAGLGSLCLLPLHHAVAAADSPGAVPAIIQKGFGLWAQNREASWAIDAWKVGGLLEQDTKPTTISAYFFRLDRTLGAYKSFDVIQTKNISPNSEVFYIAINLDHAVMYGRFMMYHTDRDWVVQNMDFSPKPEAVMPWLSFDGESYTQ